MILSGDLGDYGQQCRKARRLQSARLLRAYRPNHGLPSPNSSTGESFSFAT